jgi:hypothetical protein
VSTPKSLFEAHAVALSPQVFVFGACVAWLAAQVGDPYWLVALAEDAHCAMITGFLAPAFEGVAAADERGPAATAMTAIPAAMYPNPWVLMEPLPNSTSWSDSVECEA